MKAARVHLSVKEIHLLERVRSLGFRSVPEVLRCAALSFADSKCLHTQSMESVSDRSVSAPPKSRSMQREGAANQ